MANKRSPVDAFLKKPPALPLEPLSELARLGDVAAAPPPPKPSSANLLDVRPRSSVGVGGCEPVSLSRFGRAMYSIDASSSPSTRRAVAWLSTSLFAARFRQHVPSTTERVCTGRGYSLFESHATHAREDELGVERGRIRIEEGVNWQGERVEETTALKTTETIRVSFSTLEPMASRTKTCGKDVQRFRHDDLSSFGFFLLISVSLFAFSRYCQGFVPVRSLLLLRQLPESQLHLNLESERGQPTVCELDPEAGRLTLWLTLMGDFVPSCVDGRMWLSLGNLAKWWIFHISSFFKTLRGPIFGVALPLRDPRLSSCTLAKLGGCAESRMKIVCECGGGIDSCALSVGDWR